MMMLRQIIGSCSVSSNQMTHTLACNRTWRRILGWSRHWSRMIKLRLQHINNERRRKWSYWNTTRHIRCHTRRSPCQQWHLWSKIIKVDSECTWTQRRADIRVFGSPTKITAYPDSFFYRLISKEQGQFTAVRSKNMSIGGKRLKLYHACSSPTTKTSSDS